RTTPGPVVPPDDTDTVWQQRAGPRLRSWGGTSRGPASAPPGSAAGPGLDSPGTTGSEQGDIGKTPRNGSHRGGHARGTAGEWRGLCSARCVCGPHRAHRGTTRYSPTADGHARSLPGRGPAGPGAGPALPAPAPPDTAPDYCTGSLICTEHPEA